MRSRRRCAGALLALLTVLPVAAEPGSDDVAPRRAVNPDYLEYKPGKLASDVFQQSDEMAVSADQAVTFPTDF